MITFITESEINYQQNVMTTLLVKIPFNEV